MHYVYILKSEKDGNHYIRFTQNVQGRVNSHNQGKVKSTRHRKPFVLIRKEPYNTAVEAKRRKHQIKSFKGGETFRAIFIE